ncbi:MAG: hypothetical protein CME65_11790 [Halobacteriovoraceae bacterium]|nr:hypothetical protein [Halobacteriovoraceae bacterium]|tara:strand:- start:7450 stop:8100 length:651 start_codon:yes stop_codon:yes gene_type:complete
MSSYVQESFHNKFNQFIKNKQFESAREMLEKNGDIPKNIKLFNLGYLNYSKGNLVQAKKYYELAKLHGMLGSEVTKSLEKINEELSITSFEDQYTSYENFLFTYKTLPEPHFYLGLGFFLTVFFIGLVKKWHVLTLLGVCSIIVFGYYRYEVEQYDFAYNESDKLIQRGPSVIFEEIGVLPAGGKIFYSKQRNNWRYIEYPEVFRGWINTERNDLK